ncbi:MAG: DUF2169 domain-containing protein, partial [Chthoniobacterales bacterium]|nr:DUF2169 domain-containing protein [Chthoniobacterales bacterium]
MFLISNQPHLKVGWFFTGPPPHLGLAPKTCVWHLFCKVTARLRENAPAEIETDQPEFPNGDVPHPLGANHGLLRPSDFCPRKAYAEFTLSGTAYPPSGSESIRAFPVEVQVGSLRKVLRVYGVRKWEPNGHRFRAGQPAPASPIPLTWANSYGGPEYDWNPLGKGVSGLEMHQIDYAQAPIDHPLPNLMPAGFAPIPPHWKLRSRYLGTFTENYVAESWPWMPPDFDWRYYQSAPQDQWLSGSWQGNENIMLNGFFPDQPTIRNFQLPCGFVACVVRYHPNWTLEDKTPRESWPLVAITMALDSLHIEPDNKQIFLVWRGWLPVANIKCPNVAALSLDWFQLNSVTQEQATQHCLSRLLNMEAVQMQMVKPPQPPQPQQISELPQLEFPESPLVKAVRQVAADIIKVLEYEAEERNLGKYQQDPTIQNVLEEIEKLSQQISSATSSKFSSEQVNQELQKNPEFLNKLKELLQTLHEKENPGVPFDQSSVEKFAEEISNENSFDYRKYAEERLKKTLDQIEKLQSKYPKPLHWKDFLNEDGSVNEKKLRSTSLKGADFSGAQFLNANLSKINFSGVNFTKANLQGSNFQGAILKNTVFTEANLENVDLRHAVLEGTDFTKSQVRGVFWEGVMGTRPKFSQLELEEVEFKNIRLPEARFEFCNLNRAKLENALLLNADFVSCKIEQVNFRRAILSGANFEFCSAKGS